MCIQFSLFLHHFLTLCSLISSVSCLIQPEAAYFIMLSAGATRTQQSEYSAPLQSTMLHSASFNTLIGRELLLCFITVVFDGQVRHVLLCDPGAQLIYEALQQWICLEHFSFSATSSKKTKLVFDSFNLTCKTTDTKMPKQMNSHIIIANMQWL